MKNSKKSILFFVIYIGIIVSLQKKYPEVVYIMAAIIGSLFLFSILVRTSYAFKSFFTNRYNIFTSKVRHQRHFDIPKDILFDKIQEVLAEARFKVHHADKEKGELFATSSITIWSWGENIYLDLVAEGQGTKMDFCSACFFGATSWGKNEKNFERLLDTFEESLTI